nr:hypothetical protein [uncultured Desulfobulbus sp.]
MKATFVKPEYAWFNGTSQVYNVGETIQPDERGIYPMAKANGAPFDGKSSIVPIKQHFTIMPLHESGKLVPPASLLVHPSRLASGLMLRAEQYNKL